MSSTGLPPNGELTEIVGRLSSGRTSLFQAWLAAVTRAGGMAALVDTDDVFDPVSAARAGVNLGRLLWIRCGGRRRAALRATDLLVRRPGFALIGLDTGEIPPPLTLEAAFRLKLAVRRTGGALVLLGRRRLAGPGAALAVETVQDGLEWSGAGGRPRRLDAVRTRVRLLRPPVERHPDAHGAWPRTARWSA
jgi:hypothetical protein